MDTPNMHNYLWLSDYLITQMKRTQLISGLILTSNAAGAAGQAFGSVMLPYLFNLTVTGLLIFFMTRTILQRSGRLANFRNFSIALLFLGGLLLGQLLISGEIIGTLQAMDTNADTSAAGVIGYPMVVYVIGAVVMGVFLFFRRRDIMFWFPAKIKHK